MNQRLVLIVMLLFSLCTYAQQSTELRGSVVNNATGQPMPGVLVTLKGQNQSVITDPKGTFHFISVAPGQDVLTFSSSEIMSREFSVDIEQDAINLLKDVKLIAADMNQNMALVGMGDETILDDDGSSQEISSMVVMSNDEYLKNVRFQLSPLRFKTRGYSNIFEQKYINGVSFNDQNRGVFNFASIGALNDLTRSGDVANYNNPSTFAFGSIGGSENINMRAGNYAKGTKLTLSYTNRIYYLRAMASHSTGLQDNGWAFTAAVGGRYSNEGNVDGTFYRNFSYAIALEKQFNGGEHSISFTTFGSPVSRGQASASFQEVYNLTGNNLYNPNWGWQNGKKRNSRVVTAYDPTGILSHIWKINRGMTLTSGIGVHYARYGGTALNWYNGPDPRADYYRYLPSYWSANEDMYDLYTDYWKNNYNGIQQINWAEMYRANILNNEDLKNGVVKNSIYMVEERRSDLFEGALNSVLNAQLSEHNKLTAGLGLRSSQSIQFKTVDDMLGALYFMDRDKYAETDGTGDADNDLSRPGRRVYKDDIFGYNFRLNINSANLWLQNQYTTTHLDFYYGAKVVYTEFQRDGKMENGRYPEDRSFGKGGRHTFVDFAMKTGATYKITGRHLLTANVSYTTDAPLPNNAYISPRISDDAVKDMKSGRIFSADLNYIFSMPSLKGRVSVFQTNFYDQTVRNSYYHDAARTFVNHALTNVNKIHRGVELGVAYQINNSWSIDMAGTLAEYYYSNNPDGVISYENGSVTDIEEKAYLKNYYVGGTPQVAGTIKLNYFYDYWFIGLNLNGFGRNYIEISPFKRLASNYDGLSPHNPEQYAAYKELTHQERFGSGYTLDLSIGKVLYLKRGKAVNFNFSFQNLTDRKNIKTGGFEQSRIDVKEPNKFPSKYYYMQGFNCFLNMSYRF